MNLREALFAMIVLLCAAGCHAQGGPPLRPTLASGSLAQARRAHATHLLVSGPSPQEYGREVPPDVRAVAFVSSGRQLRAWLAVPPGPGPHPAVLFAHGGFALGAGDFDGARPFVKAGFAVLVPAWRGENGNPGAFEFCYGEVDDAAAALDALARVPDVDPKRLYATGHSIGGTLAVLLAEVSPRLRKAAACGAFPNMRDVIERAGRPVFEQTPFDWRNPLEADLRSPGLHVADLNCPLALYYGANERLYSGQARAMAEEGTKLGKSVRVETIPGTDHFTALAPAVQKMIAYFRL